MHCASLPRAASLEREAARREPVVSESITLDRDAVLTKILPNGECGCRGEDGNQSRLNASANLERPVQSRPFGFSP
jgi:hypothetical protein